MGLVLQTIHQFDITVYRYLTGFAGNWFLDRLASHEEGNNLLKGVVFFTFYWYLWFVNDVNRDRRRQAILKILTGAILGIIVCRTIAFIAPFRPRPIYDPTLVHASYSVHFTYNLENWNAFPSDTAAYFFALAFGVAHLLPRFRIPIALYTAGWICLPRMYLGLHHASDVVVGSTIGIAMVWLSLRSTWLQSLARRALAAMEKKPEWFYGIAFLVCYEMATIFAELRLAGRALLHAVLIGLHLRTVRSGQPLHEWGGLLAIAAALLTVFASSVLYRKLREARVIGKQDNP